jgi:hypothetical protein
MPKAPCPACKSEVKYDKDAEIGSTVTCPECDEVFTPPKLKKKKKEKKYDPATDEDTYKVGRAPRDPDEKAKSQKVAAAVHHAARRAREETRPKRPQLFGGPEIVLLVFAVAFTVALPVGFVVAKRFPSTGESALITFAYLGMFFAVGFKMIRARWRAGG